jgi:Zn-dependent protease with chaperone function
MDFFARQDQAKRQTRRLAWLFGLAILAVLIVNNLLVCSLVYCFTHPVFRNEPAYYPINFSISALYLLGEALTYLTHFFKLIFHWQPILWTSLGTLASIAGGCYFKIRQLSEGGSVVAEFLGGRRLAANLDDPDEQRLRNVVEEMAVSSGTSVPEIYVLDNERGINSFAAGFTRDDIAIGVTRGCVKLLTRDELQGVIAHEFSHILNGDTRLNMKLIGLAHGLFWPTLLGRLLMRGSTEDPDPSETIFDMDSKPVWLPTAPLGFLFWVLGMFNLPFVRLIKSAICRQREWLADAEAVQFTRYPAGIAGALKKIGGLFKEGRLDTPHAEVASHLYFTNSDYEPWLDVLSTHPPLTKRISAIDPTFDGNFPHIKMLKPNQTERDSAFDNVIGNAMLTERALPEAVLGMWGAVSGEHIRQASLIRLALPDDLKRALRTSSGAANVVYLLLLSEDEAVRARQMEVLQARLEPPVFEQFNTLAPQVETLDYKYKLPLGEFAVPALRENDLAAHGVFSQTMQDLLDCDGSIDLFEYTLTKMVARQLRAHFEGPDLANLRPGRVQDVLPECALLLSALAHVGSDNEAEARKFFAKGKEFLDLRNANIHFLPRSEWDLAKVDVALAHLAIYHEPLKRNVLLACGKTVIANNQVNCREAELLRAIADSLDCPMPPFVEAIRGEELAKSS